MIKKISIWVAVVLMIITCGAGYRVKASGDEYIYTEVSKNKKAWLKIKCIKFAICLKFYDFTVLTADLFA